MPVRVLMSLMIVLFVFFSSFSSVMGQETGDEKTLTFAIHQFEIAGNTKLPSGDIDAVLDAFVGPHQTAEDVEKARTTLEQFYHKNGYPTALINIPEQTVESGVVRLEVIESKIRRVRITGNNYFTMESILKKMPSFRPGEILYLPDIQEELAQVNSNPDLKVAPVLVPGKELGTIDVELKVKDKLPLHGSLELNNRNTHDTSRLRLNALLRYDNLWQKAHSITLQYQMSPEHADEVRALAVSYVLPAPWNSDHIVAMYGIMSDSEVAFGEGFQTVGKGYIAGFRDVIPLPEREKYTHSLSLGLDYKDYDDELSFESGGDTETTPITYLPISFSYNSALNHHSGISKFSLGMNMVFRGLVTDRSEFEDKRYKSRGNYVYGTLGIERYQMLPFGFQLLIKGDGQLSDQPLPSNEQYIAGGLQSVRGYKESESVGDNALHGTAELSYPKLAQRIGLPDWVSISPNIFYDIVSLRILSPLSGQQQPGNLAGAGAGVRGKLSSFLDYEVAWGMALEPTEETGRGDQEVYFVVKGQF